MKICGEQKVCVKGNAEKNIRRHSDEDTNQKHKASQTVKVTGAASHLSPLSIAHPKTTAIDQWREIIGL